MRRQLVLVRHAKAAQGSPDISRPLTDRGRADASEIGRWLRANDAVPDVAIVSPATRTMQTWESAASALGATTKRHVLYDAKVWANSVANLVAAITDQIAQSDDVTTIAVVGHNPSIHALTVRLAGSAEGLGDFPTATVALFALDDWHNLDAATLVTYATCRANQHPG